MGIVSSVFSLCNKKQYAKKDDIRVIPSDNEIIEINTNNPDVSTFTGIFYLIIVKQFKDKIHPIVEIFDDNPMSVNTVTLVGMYNNDNYFTPDDIEYYKKKYANEIIYQKKSSVIR